MIPKERDNNPGLQELVEGGIPLSRLEQRLRPSNSLPYAEERVAHDNFMDYSHQGFLGAHERLLDVVQADWEVINRYTTSHKAIAEALRSIIPPSGRVFDYGGDIPELPNPEYEYIPPHGLTAGFQTCPWGEGENIRGQNGGVIVARNITEDERIFVGLVEFPTPVSDLWKMLSEGVRGKPFPIEMQERYEAAIRVEEEVISGQRPLFYTRLTQLLPHLVEEHYFFEGRETIYRADPEIIIKAFNLEGVK